MKWPKRIALGLAGVLVLVVAAAVGFVAWHWAPDIPRAELEDRWAGPASRFLEIDGMEVHVRDEGPKDDAAPILLLHGTSDSLHAWDAWAEALVADGRRVIRYDLPGFGLTGPPPSGGLQAERYLRVHFGVMDALGVERAIMGGNSFGGRIAWTAALERPERAAGLILVAASGLPTEPTEVPPGFALAGLPGVKDALRNTLPRFLIRMSLESVYGDPSRVTEAEVDRFMAMTRRAGNRDVVLGRVEFGEFENLSHRLPEIAVPALVLWGGEDRLIPPAAAERFEAGLPDAEAVVIEGLGHVPHTEGPERTLEAVRAWLARADL